MKRTINQLLDELLETKKLTTQLYNAINLYSNNFLKKNFKNLNNDLREEIVNVSITKFWKALDNYNEELSQSGTYYTKILWNETLIALNKIKEEEKLNVNIYNEKDELIDELFAMVNDDDNTKLLNELSIEVHDYILKNNLIHLYDFLYDKPYISYNHYLRRLYNDTNKACDTNTSYKELMTKYNLSLIEIKNKILHQKRKVLYHFTGINPNQKNLDKSKELRRKQRAEKKEKIDIKI